MSLKNKQGKIYGCAGVIGGKFLRNQRLGLSAFVRLSKFGQQFSDGLNNGAVLGMLILLVLSQTTIPRVFTFLSLQKSMLEETSILTTKTLSVSGVINGAFTFFSLFQPTSKCHEKRDLMVCSLMYRPILNGSSR